MTNINRDYVEIKGVHLDGGGHEAVFPKNLTKEE